LLPRKDRLNKNQEIRKVIEDRKDEFSTPLFNLITSENDNKGSRVCIVTPAKIGNAVKRNKIKRIFKRAYLNIKHKIAKKNKDIVIFPKKSRKITNINDIENSLEMIFSEM